jgi:hypothetical protein
MTRWEYKTVYLKIASGADKKPGYFTRSEDFRSITDNSDGELQQLGAEGWELVSICLLDMGSFESGPQSAAAFLKRPIEQ